MNVGIKQELRQEIHKLDDIKIDRSRKIKSFPCVLELRNNVSTISDLKNVKAKTEDNKKNVKKT